MECVEKHPSLMTGNPDCAIWEVSGALKGSGALKAGEDEGGALEMFQWALLVGGWRGTLVIQKGLRKSCPEGNGGGSGG